MLYLLIAILVVAADQLLKFWVVKNIPIHGVIGLIPRVLHLTHEQNQGMAFSMLEGARWIFVGITAALCIVMIVFLFRTTMGKPGKIAVAVVLGGAIGNVIDRVLYGYVIDMLEAEFVEFAVCNFADCAIVVGAIVFFFCYLIHIKKLENAEKKPTTGPAVPRHEEKMLRDEDGDFSETAILEEADFERRMSEGKDSD